MAAEVLLKPEDTNVSTTGQTQETTAEVLSAMELEFQRTSTRADMTTEVLLVIKTSRVLQHFVILRSSGEGQVQFEVIFKR